MLKASALSEDPSANLQLALGIELAVLPPYLYALWSIKSAGEGASQAAAEAAYAIRTVVYEEMLHAGLVANLLNALGVRPDLTAHLMSYPGPLPGHVTEPPWGYEVGLGPLCATALGTFLRIERPVWDPPPGLDQGWITLGQFYGTLTPATTEAARARIRRWPSGPAQRQSGAWRDGPGCRPRLRP